MSNSSTKSYLLLHKLRSTKFGIYNLQAWFHRTTGENGHSRLYSGIIPVFQKIAISLSKLRVSQFFSVSLYTLWVPLQASCLRLNRLQRNRLVRFATPSLTLILYKLTMEKKVLPNFRFKQIIELSILYTIIS